jgi:CspA family cold shock protein
MKRRRLSGRTLDQAIADEIEAHQRAARRILNAAMSQGRLEPQGGIKTGTVRFWNDEKGWGFINPDNGSDSIYVHFKNVIGNGRRTLAAGERVGYQVTKGPRGLLAINVQKLAVDLDFKPPLGP